MSASPKPGSWIHSMKPITSSRATGSFIPDSPSSERARRFSQGRAAQHGEDRRRVGGGDRRADQHPFEHADAENPVWAASPARPAVGDLPDRRQRGGGAEDGADLRPARRQPALEEDEDEGDRPEGPGQFGVLEIDPPNPSSRRPGPEEEQQAGDAHRSASRAPTIPAASRAPATRIGSASCPAIGTLVERIRRLVEHAAVPRVPPATGAGTSSAHQRAAVDRGSGGRGGRRRRGEPISTGELVLTKARSSGDEDRRAADPAHRRARTWPWAIQAWLTVTEARPWPIPTGTRAGPPGRSRTSAEGDLHRLRPGDQDATRRGR